MNARQLTAALALSTSFLAYSAQAANFEVTNGQTVTSTQAIGTGDNETGVVDHGGTIHITTAIDGMQTLSTGGTLTNNGTIDMTGTTGANTIEIDNANNRVTNNGTINIGDNAGMLSIANGTTFINNGSMTVGSGAGGGVAIFQGTGSGTIINNGSITSTDATSIGIASTADDTTITNNGSIHFTGSNSAAIQSNALNNAVVNNGTIDVTAIGIAISDTTSTAINNGTITSGNHAMYSFGSGNTMTNNGSIHSTNGYGMYGDAVGNTLTNNGNIIAEGTDNRGMYSSANANILVNRGSITTSGTNVDGILSDGAGTTTITNYGTVHTSGTDSDGLAASANNTVTNYGTVTATGSNGYGVYTGGNNITVINRGRITSQQANAIYLPNNNDALVVGMNSVTQGGVAFGGTGHTVTYDLSGTPRQGGVIAVDSITGTYTPSIINQATLPAGARVVQSGNNVAVVTSDQFASSSQTVTQTLDYTGDIINNRFETAMLGGGLDYDGGTQYAAASINDASPASGYAVRDHNMAWTEAFGSYQERPHDGDTDYTQAKAGGVLAGVDLPSSDDGVRAGLYVGGVSGSTEIGQTAYRTIDSDGALAGGYLGKSFGGYFVSGQLATGLVHNGSARDTGVDMASAGYDSAFVSPALTVMRPIPGNSVTLVPQATLRYTSQWDTAYTESGSVENEHVDGHNINTLEARALMEAHFNDITAHDGIIKPSVRVGAQYQTYLGSRSLDANIFGTSINFDPTGGDNNVDGIIGATLAYKLTNGPELYADGEGDLGLSKGGPADNFGLTGRLGARWKF